LFFAKIECDLNFVVKKKKTRNISCLILNLHFYFSFSSFLNEYKFLLFDDDDKKQRKKKHKNIYILFLIIDDLNQKEREKEKSLFICIININSQLVEL